ncbi:MAG: spore coat protein U domain-containing protein [Bdellovibrionota bacterium]
MIFLWLLLSGIAQASCNNLRVNLANSNFDLTSNSAPALSLTVQRAGSGGCDYFITFDYGASASYSDRKLFQSGGYTLPANIYRDSNHTQILKKVPDAATTSDVIMGNFPDGTNNPNSAIQTYYPTVDISAYNRFGDYSDTFTARIYQYTGSFSGTSTDSDTVKLKYTMAKKIDLSLVATGAAFNAADTTENMAFGTLTAGAVRTFDIGVKYNAGYRVKVSSANQGMLKHSTLVDTVPYSLQVNSATVNLVGSNSTPVQVATGTGVSASNGLFLTSSVTIGALGSARAGTYTDTVTVTVATTE